MLKQTFKTMTKQRKPLAVKIAELEYEIQALRAINTSVTIANENLNARNKELIKDIQTLTNDLIKANQTISELEREKIKNDKPWYSKFFTLAIVLVVFASCQKEPISEYSVEEIASERSVTIIPFSRIQRNDTTIILDGDSRMRKYCCTIYRESGVPYGDCYSSSGECVSCQEVCAIAVPRR